MKNYNTLYYLLFVLLIMGAFSSMAQNNYGNGILGGVAVVFALLFSFQLAESFRTKATTTLVDRVELVSLAVISSILALRVFYIHFQFVETIFIVSGMTLLFARLSKLITAWRTYSARNNALALVMSAFHSSIILYVVSMTVVPVGPAFAEPAGMAAFALIIAFAIVAYFAKDFMVGGEKVSALRIAARSSDRSVILLSLFLVFTTYMGLTKIGVLPRLYSDEYPQMYFQLVNQAETGNEKPVEGEYQHEAFKKAYDRFIERNAKK
ncbi:MAG: hypothetical protein SH819_09145 [Cytophagales bacterium]|nr:hypothetical protein [Cytophagales bacterium]